MADLGWWCIHGEALLGMLREVADGGDPDLVYAEHYSNAEREEPRWFLPTT